VVGGLIALVVVLAVSSAAGLALRRRQGRFRAAGSTPLPRTAGTGDAPDAAPSGREPAVPDLSTADLGTPLGARATLVQFSTEVCAYCGPVRRLLTEVAAETDGVTFVEVDAAARMDLTRRLHVLSTPTVLVLDAGGGIASRASGPVRRSDLVAAVGQALGPGGEM
jgi:thioredoxin-like negative regulator of GroEL